MSYRGVVTPHLCNTMQYKISEIGNSWLNSHNQYNNHVGYIAWNCHFQRIEPLKLDKFLFIEIQVSK